MKSKLVTIKKGSKMWKQMAASVTEEGLKTNRY
jgi:hypothetical protein